MPKAWREPNFEYCHRKSWFTWASRRLRRKDRIARPCGLIQVNCCIDWRRRLMPYATFLHCLPAFHKSDIRSRESTFQKSGVRALNNVRDLRNPSLARLRSAENRMHRSRTYWSLNNCRINPSLNCDASSSGRQNFWKSPMQMA